MKRILLFALLVLAAQPAFAQSNIRVVGRAPDGIDRPVLVTADGKLQVSQAADSSGNAVIPIAAPTSYTMMTNATPAATQSPSPGVYNLELPATFNGATITLTVTTANSKVSTFTYTSPVAAKTCFRFSSGTTASVSVTGGTPSGTTVLAGAVQCSQPGVENYTQVALTANTAAQIATPLTGMINGLVCTASSANTTDVLVGTSAVATTETGSGNGYPMIPGGSWAAGLNTTANTWFISSAAAVIFCHGN